MPDEVETYSQCSQKSKKAVLRGVVCCPPVNHKEPRLGELSDDEEDKDITQGQDPYQMSFWERVAELEGKTETEEEVEVDDETLIQQLE